MNYINNNYGDIVIVIKNELVRNNEWSLYHNEEVAEAISRVANICAIKTAWLQQDYFLENSKSVFFQNIFKEDMLLITLKLTRGDDYDNFKLVKIVFKIKKLHTTIAINKDFKNPEFTELKVFLYKDATKELVPNKTYSIYKKHNTLVSGTETFLITKLDYDDLGLDTDVDIVKIFIVSGGTVTVFRVNSTGVPVRIRVARILKELL